MYESPNLLLYIKKALKYPFTVKNYEIVGLKAFNGKYLVVSDSGVVRCDCDTDRVPNSHFRVVFDKNMVNLKNELYGYLYGDPKTGYVYGNGNIGTPGVPGNAQLFSVLMNGTDRSTVAFVTDSGQFLKPMPDNTVMFAQGPPDSFCMFKIVRAYSFTMHKAGDAVSNFFSDLGKGINKCLDNDEKSQKENTNVTTGTAGIAVSQPPMRLPANAAVITTAVKSMRSEQQLHDYMAGVINSTIMTTSDIFAIMQVLVPVNIRRIVLQHAWIADPQNFNVVLPSLRDEGEIQIFTSHPAVIPFRKM